MHPKARLQPPNRTFLLGTDEFGRDILSRIIWGSRLSLKISFLSVGLAALGGIPLGLLSGYYGGILDAILMRIMDVIFAFPVILLAILILAMLGSTVSNLILVLGLIYLPAFTRLTRGATLSMKEKPHIESARALGASDLRIILRHILPNITSPLTVHFTLNLAFAILAEAALNFLGLGTRPPTPSWGLMLSSSLKLLQIAPWLAIFPGLAIAWAVLGFNLLGDGLREWLSSH
jgi:peptide/nickel transport system permease protein